MRSNTHTPDGVRLNSINQHERNVNDVRMFDDQKWLELKHLNQRFLPKDRLITNTQIRNIERNKSKKNGPK